MKVSSLIATSVFVSSLVFHPFNDAQNSAPFGVAYADEAQDFELLKASQSGDLSAAKKAIAAGANVNAMSGNGISAIMYAAGKGHTDIVRLLLKSGANPNLAGTTNITPLMCAAMYGRHDVVQMLLAAGAKREVADDKGNTAYTYAAKFPAIAQMLAPQTTPQTQPTNATVDVDYQLIASAQAGNLAEVQKAIAAGANVNAMSGNGISAIMYAAGKGHTDVVRLLLKSGANPNLAGTTNITPLMTAAMFGRHDIVQMLLAAGAKKNVTDDKGNTAYTYAAKFPAIAQMLAPQTAPQAQPTGLNPVQLFIKGLENKDSSLVKKAIASGLDVTGPLDQKGWTALMFAAQDGLTEAIKALAQAGTKIDAKDNLGWTPLMLAAQNGHTEAIKALAQAGAKLEATNKSGHTPLMIAAYNGHTEAVKALIQAGANANEKSKDGLTALAYAEESNSKNKEEIINLLAPLTMNPVQLFVKGLENKDVKLVEKAIASGLDVTGPLDQKGWTALMFAAYNGHTEAIKALAQAGTKIDAKDNLGWTPLMLAAQNGHTEAIKALAQAGAKIDAKDNLGWTALILAAQNGHTEAIKALAQAGAKLEATNKSGHTPLMIAAYNGHTEAVKALIHAGANANEKNKNGYTALAYAKGSKSKNKEEIINLLAPLTMNPVQLFVKGLKNKDVKLVEKAIASGLDVTGPLDQEGWTALMFAAQDGHTEAIKALAQAGAKLETKDKEGLTPLMIAAANNKFEAVKALIHAGAKIDAKDNLGWTALMFAASNGHSETVKALIQAGANIEAKDKNSWTALMNAAQDGHTEAIKALAQAGAKLEATNKGGLTPLCLAAINGHSKAVKALIAAGANIHHKIKKTSIMGLVAAAQPGEKDKSTQIIFALAKAGAKPTQHELDCALYGDKPHIDNAVALVLLGAPYNQKYINTFAYKYPNRAPELCAWMRSVKKGDNPLYEALHSDDKRILKAITLSDIDLNQPICSEGYTALGLASLSGKAECVKILIQGGVDVNKKDRDGHTALDYAEAKNQRQIINLLKQAGAR